MANGNLFLEANAEQLGISGQKINSASVDLEISNKIKLLTFGGYKPKSLIKKPDYNPYNQILVDANDFEPIVKETEVDLDEFPDGIWIRPGVGILCDTKSHLTIPDNMVGQVLLKSSRGREFYQSCMAGYFDNGFPGTGTLEIYAPVIPIFFQTGLKIVQMRYDELKDYSFTYRDQVDAKYLNQSGPTGSRDAKF